MYARVTTIQIEPAKLPELVAKLGEFKANAKGLKGVINTYAVWRADGHCVVTSIYTDKASADAAMVNAQATLAGLASAFKGMPKIETYDSVEHLSG